jgi:hypothetical protein
MVRPPCTGDSRRRRLPSSCKLARAGGRGLQVSALNEYTTYCVVVRDVTVRRSLQACERERRFNLLAQCTGHVDRSGSGTHACRPVMDDICNVWKPIPEMQDEPARPPRLCLHCQVCVHVCASQAGQVAAGNFCQEFGTPVATPWMEFILVVASWFVACLPKPGFGWCPGVCLGGWLWLCLAWVPFGCSPGHLPGQASEGSRAQASKN